MIARHNPMGIYHRAIVNGDVIYLSGMVADNKSLPMSGQARQALEKIDQVLRSVGSDAFHLLHVSIYVTDVSLREEFNDAWCSFFPEHARPTRALMGVKELGPGTLVELVATAGFPSKIAAEKKL